MITTQDKIGYISKATLDGKDQYEFIEAKVKSVRIGKKKTSVYTDRFYVLDAKEIESNTSWINDVKGLILINEPFVTTPEYSELCRKNVDHWNKYGTSNPWDAIFNEDTSLEAQV